jgi:hypothetical protein
MREQAGISSVLILMVAVSLLAWIVTALFSCNLPREDHRLVAPRALG